MQLGFRYTNNAGESFEVSPDGPYFEASDPFRSHEYEYRDYNDTVKEFTRPLAEFEHEVQVHAETRGQLADLVNRLVEVVEHDRRLLMPGTIEVAGWKTSGYVYAVEDDAESDVDGWVCYLTLSFVLEDPTWVMEEKLSFYPSEDPGQGDGWLDFPFDFPFDFGRTSGVYGEVFNDDIVSCPFRLVVYGFAVDPSVRIGGNLYQVNTTVEAGGRLVIDSRAPDIYVVGRLGDVASRIDERLRGSSGSGTYVFEPIQAGHNVVTWDRSFRFDLILLHERPQPPMAVEGETESRWSA